MLVAERKPSLIDAASLRGVIPIKNKFRMGFDEEAIRPYAHFDRRISYAKIRNQVENPSWVSKHGFFPLISKTIADKKYDGAKEKRKVREVAYASHVDRCIYQRYSFLLNQLYNDYAIKNKINSSSIAYRNNLGKCNIDFALSAFKEISGNESCWILIADFKDFFPSLDHEILKEQLRAIFPDGIPDDFYHVYRSVIHWSQWDIKKILASHSLDPNKTSSVRKLNKLDTALTRSEFRRKVKNEVEQPWRITHKGIPQGLPISGILANIYMKEFDKTISSLAHRANGLYMRYSDDVILIIPDCKIFTDIVNRIKLLCKKYKLRIEADKTSFYLFENDSIFKCIPDGNCFAKERLSKLQYLGFDFDGSSIKIRQKTIGRYYKKMHRRVRFIYHGNGSPSKKRVHELYRLYSNKGRKLGRGNFISYARRAERKCAKTCTNLTNELGSDIDKHYLKIRRETQRAEKESGFDANLND